MTHNTLPKSPRVLLLDLSAIKHIMNEKHTKKLKGKSKESTKKQSVSGGTGEQVHKKSKPMRFCQCCKDKGGMHFINNTNECCKYNKDGNLSPSIHKSFTGKGGNKQLAFLMAAVESLVKKGLKKAATRTSSYTFLTASTVIFCSKRCLTMMMCSRYPLLFPCPKADIWKFVPSGN